MCAGVAGGAGGEAVGAATVWDVLESPEQLSLLDCKTRRAWAVQASVAVPRGWSEAVALAARAKGTN
jgi:hypothetical protein